MTIAQKILSLNALFLTFIMLSVVASTIYMPLFRCMNKFLKTIINIIIYRINIFSHILLLGLLIFGGFSISFIQFLDKNFLDGPYFTLFIRFYFISDDG